jgi:lysophospholipase L1-like esterase
MRRSIIAALGLAALVLSAAVQAQQPWTLSDNLRYLAMGDSLTAGYGATPVTNGYAYGLYQQGAYDSMNNTIFANAAVPGATSQQVLNYQVPQATQIFQPHVITMTVGGNDLLAILQGANPGQVLQGFQNNLSMILMQLCSGLPSVRIYVANLYSIHDFPVPTDPAVDAFNQVVAGVAAFANGTFCGGRVKVADVHAAFAGAQQGLLLINRKNAGPFEVHPTNAGYRAMTQAFLAAR